MWDFADRHVVVTGGTGALGRCVTEGLLDAGAVCHVPARSSRPEAARHERLHITGGIDLLDEESVRGFYAGLPSVWASIHCAGGFAMGPVEETSARDLTAMVEANLRTTFLCCREAVRRMRAAASAEGRRVAGRIVNVASQQALDPRRGARMSAYTASKAAVAGLTVALAEEVAQEGIWVNAVAPSILDTEANRRAMPDADFSRWPKLDEVAATMLFLASPANQASQGAVVPVFGRA